MNNEHTLQPPSAAQERREPAQSAVQLVQATVLDRQEELFVLATQGGDVRLAARAESCLLLPENGDLTLLSLAPHGGRSHILAVLERPNPGERRFELGPQTTLTSSKGELAANARALRLEAEEDATLRAATLHMEAAEGRARFLRFSLAARQAQVLADSAKLLAKNLDQRVERAMLRMGDCYRRVRGLEHVIAGSAAWLVRGRLTQKAQNACLDAEEHVSINGKHIDLG